MNRLLAKKVAVSILAMGALSMSGTVFASGDTALENSGGYDDGRGGYIGNFFNGSNVVINKEIDGRAYGSKSDNGTLSNNKVTLNVGCSSIGAEVTNGNAINNSVIINKGVSVTGSIYGAYVKTGNATGNSVVINEGGTITGDIYGASVTKGNATGNAVIINGGEISSAEIVGANVITGDALSNYVEIKDGEITASPVYGAKVENGNAAGNMVVINGGIAGSIFGAGVDKGNATGNTIVVNSGTTGPLRGVYIKNQGTAESNTVIINNGSVQGVVYGALITGEAESKAAGNGIIVNGGSVNFGSLYGAVVENGTAEGNYVIVNNVKPDSSFDVWGVEVRNGTAKNNLVIYNNEGTVEGFLEGAHVGYFTETADNKAENNAVIINNGTILRGVYGARVGEGSAEGNAAIINGGTIKSDVYGVYGGYTEYGSAEGNAAIINDGSIESNVYGGYAYEGDALNNQVNINGGKIAGTVYGGYATEGKAKGNVITISGDADLREATLIAGVENANSGNFLLSENTAGENTIRLNGWSGSVAGISGTDVIEINGSKLTDNNGILNITSGKEGDLRGTTIRVNSIAGGQNVAVGDNLTIITSKNNANLGIEAENIEISEDGIMGGVASSINGVFDIDESTGKIVFTVKSVQAAKQTAITTETRAAAAAMVNQGSEVIADSISKLQYEDAGVSTFATISGNNSKYKTGSYVDINGWNGIVGAAKTKVTNSGKLSYGAFFENGSGNYNTYNDFNGNVLRGDGNAVYNGGGLLMRYAKENGVYTEASVRAGLAKNEVSHALAETGGQTHGFKTENAYYGAHIGIGKLIKLEKGKAWDIYGKYFYTHHEGDSVTIANDNFDFDAINSSRLRLGARFSEQQGDKLSSYYGLAWDYEFSGEAGGTAAGHSLYAPSLEGSTVIGELGFRYTPDKAGGWYFDASVKGYAGQQEGLSGSVQAVYSF